MYKMCSSTFDIWQVDRKAGSYQLLISIEFRRFYLYGMKRESSAGS